MAHKKKQQASPPTPEPSKPEIAVPLLSAPREDDTYRLAIAFREALESQAGQQVLSYWFNRYVMRDETGDYVSGQRAVILEAMSMMKIAHSPEAFEDYMARMREKWVKET
jgi:maltooligosyltrehalose synthase